MTKGHNVLPRAVKLCACALLYLYGFMHGIERDLSVITLLWNV